MVFIFLRVMISATINIEASDCCLTPNQQYLSYIKLHFKEMMMMMAALYVTNTLSWIAIVLAHWNNRSRVEMSDILYWFRTNQSLLFFLNAECLAEKQHIPGLWSLVWPDQDVNPRSIALEASTLDFYTTYAINIVVVKLVGGG